MPLLGIGIAAGQVIRRPFKGVGFNNPLLRPIGKDGIHIFIQIHYLVMACDASRHRRGFQLVTLRVLAMRLMAGNARHSRRPMPAVDKFLILRPIQIMRNRTNRINVKSRIFQWTIT